MTHQTLDFGPIHLQREDQRSSVTVHAQWQQRRTCSATTNGALDPLGGEHLVGEMGGLWAHPVKFADGWYTVIHEADNMRRR